MLQLTSFSKSSWEFTEILESWNSSFGGGLALYTLLKRILESKGELWKSGVLVLEATFWCVLISVKNFQKSKGESWNPEIRVLEVAWLQLKSFLVQLGIKEKSCNLGILALEVAWVYIHSLLNQIRN